MKAKKLFDKLFIWILFANNLVFLVSLVAAIAGGRAVGSIAFAVILITLCINAVLYFIFNLSQPAEKTQPEAPTTPWPNAGTVAHTPPTEPEKPTPAKTSHPEPKAPAKAAKTVGPQVARAPRSAALAERDRRLSPEKIKKFLQNALPFPKDEAGDSRPLFRRRLGSAVQPFFSFRHEQCTDGVWEIMQTGVLVAPDSMKAEPVQRYSRQKSYGFVLGGEDLDTPYTFEALSKDLNAACTAENWQTFLDDNDRAQLEKLRSPAPPLQLEPARCAYTGSRGLQSISLDVQLHFGSRFVYLRRCGGHWRAFSISSSATNNTSLPAALCAGGFPTEETIDQILQSFPGRCFDRQLSQVEEDYFFSELTRAAEDDLEPTKSLYGPLPTVIKLLVHGGETQVFTGSCRYHQRLENLIEELAEKGAVLLPQNNT